MLYVVTRADLAPGAQAAQAMHAALEFVARFPRAFTDWRRVSNTLVVLAAESELALVRLCADAAAAGLPVARFREPDLDDALTAVALMPAARGRFRPLARLPLALRGEVNS